MSVSMRTRFSLLGAGLILSAIASSATFSDDVTLQSGGVLRGKVAKSGKTVAVTTAGGTHIVVDRSSVKTIDHDSGGRSNGAHRSKLTIAQEAWFPKIRKLVNQAASENKNASGRALRDLRSINDPDAIPALSQYLRTSNLDSVRLLYVRILGDIPGSQPVVSLIEEALFDSSIPVREAAQAATKKQPARNVRPYYGQALRFPNREVVCRAASVLTAVGDKENVPALIDSLYSTGVDIVYRPSCCMSRVAFLSPSTRGSYSRAYAMTGPEPLEATPVVRNLENPQVREALEAITKQSYGYNQDAWRRWWQSEQLAEANRRGER